MSSISSNEINYYDILELNPDCSKEDIAEAYRHLSLKYHPKTTTQKNSANFEYHFQNLAEAYGEVAFVETSVDDEINKAIGTDLDVQKSLAEMKQKLLANPDAQNNDNIDDLKKDLEP